MEINLRPPPQKRIKDKMRNPIIMNTLRCKPEFRFSVELHGENVESNYNDNEYGDPNSDVDRRVPIANDQTSGSYFLYGTSITIP
jgi:hypothetical protein